MFDSVVVPFWAAVLVAALAVLAVVDRLVLPVVRYILARRRELAHERLNARLSLPIRPFKLAGRRALVDKLMLDPEVLAAIDSEAKSTGRSVRQVTLDARRYAFEVVPAFSAATYFRFGTAAARALSTWLYRVRLISTEADIEAIDANATVVFILNHRSNMDYVLVTYLAASRSALSYAVGEWARVAGLERLIRAMGGYFVRRDSSNPLYRKVLARYIGAATAAGVTQAVFPEGGLSRDGALQPARLGIISYIMAGFDPASGRDVVFVPVGINYDRVLEDRVLMAAAATPKGQRPSFAFSPWIFARLLWRNLAGRLSGSWYRYGYAAVAFGRPISLKAWLRDRGADPRTLADAQRTAIVERFGGHLMTAVGEVVPALPVALAATVLLRADGNARSLLELKADVLALMRDVRRRGGVVHVPRADEDYAVAFGIRMLLLRGVIAEREGLIQSTGRDRGLLTFYANSIAHLVPATAQRDVAPLT